MTPDLWTLISGRGSNLSRWAAVVATLVVALGMVGCGGQGEAPKELGVEEIPAAVRQAFAGSGGELGAAAQELVASVEANEDAKAYLQLQNLLARTDLSEAQRDVVSRSLMTMGQRLNAARDSGDEAASEVMEIHRSMK